MSADDMIARGELEEVAADPESAAAALVEAARQVESASAIAENDPNGAQVDICGEDA
ncbi:MAG: hypothetical protein H0T61_10585 [Actinobacteria bacterium]|nr:hypothetical protein [Actinomycetota bacterium]